MTQQVAAGFTLPSYNPEPPYHPDQRFPELPFEDVSAGANFPYRLFRRLLLRLGFDAERFGTSDWNPFAGLIEPAQTVLIKPNFVLSANPAGNVFASVTHPSIIRALVDYAFIALRGEGRIIVADAPQMDCEWDQLMAVQRLDAIQSFYRDKLGFDVELYDLRSFAVIDPQMPPYPSNRKPLPGDPEGSITVDLGRRSELEGLPDDNYYGADYDRAATIARHHGQTHEYCMSKTVLSADVLISAPKMKVHKKVGITLNLKGMVGTVADKNCLVHYRLGTSSEGGDQLPDGRPAADRAAVKAQRWLFDRTLAKRSRFGELVYKAALAGYRGLIRPLRRVSDSTLIQDAGNWHGNDTAWRMVADLAKIIFFADADGSLHDIPQRRMFCLVDGIIGGENNGPLAPDAKPCGCLVAGQNPFAVDMVTARLMGFDVRRIRQFGLPFQGDWDFGLNSSSDIEVALEDDTMEGDLFFDPSWTDPLLAFKPHPGWRGQMEI